MANTSGYPPPVGWEDSLLQQLKAPTTQTNEQFLDAVAVAEHGTGSAGWGGTGAGEGAGAYNPVNSVEPMGGSTRGNSFGVHNSFGVQNYPSWAVGEAANVDYFNQANSAPILQQLQSGDATLTELESTYQNEVSAWGGHESYPSAGTQPATGSSTSPFNFSGLTSWTNYTGNTDNTGSGSGTPATSATEPLVTSAPWGGLLGSQI